jgi:8-oxo-dGTP diphosphatase
VKQIKYKVFAYITNRQRLLLFRHVYAPEAGIQVPAGTLEAGELPEVGVLREALEETGLSGLTIDCFLGEQVRDMSEYVPGEINHRYFYHLRCPGDPPDSWRHEERNPSTGPEPVPLIFEFFWVALPHRVPPLIADHDCMIPELMNRLSPTD